MSCRSWFLLFVVLMHKHFAETVQGTLVLLLNVVLWFICSSHKNVLIEQQVRFSAVWVMIELKCTNSSQVYFLY